MCASDVHVEVLRRDTNESNPDNVLRQILNFQNVYELEDDDQLWIVIDRDRWPEQMLAAVAQHCAQGKDRKSTRLNSSHANISYAVFCLKKKKEVNSRVWRSDKRLI